MSIETTVATMDFYETRRSIPKTELILKAEASRNTSLPQFSKPSYSNSTQFRSRPRVGFCDGARPA